MRARLLSVAVLPVAVLAASCGQGGADPATSTSASPTTPGAASDAAATVSADLDKVDVAVVPGTSAKLTLPSTPFVAAPGYRVVKEGDGAPLVADNTVVADVLVVNGRDGKELESSYAAGKSPAALGLGDASLLPGIKTSLVGRRVGSQVLVAVPAATANQSVNITANDTLLFLFVLKEARTPLKQAEGAAVPPKAGLPTVVMGATSKDPAVITVPKADPPTATVAQPLIIGAGAKVVAGQKARVAYTGVTWRDPSKPFDYSGKQASGYAEFRVGVGELIKAWDKHIVGQTIGSRLLLIVPPAEGYGEKGSGEIKGTDTLVFVIDVLDAS
jgi:peptidylprolyl isomerase